MENVLRALIENGQISFTAADTTEIVREGMRRHGLSTASAYAFGKALSAMTFMSACLKQETGEISLSVQGVEEGGNIAVSGNYGLYLRGYIDNVALVGEPNAETERRALGNRAVLTVIRDDGYSRPFVGSCAVPDGGGIDEAFEEYFRSSEQLRTRIATTVLFTETGECAFAGVVALQPLPFASADALAATERADLSKLLRTLQRKGIAACAAELSERRTAEERRFACYRCNCSREYLRRVLVSLGEEQMRAIIKEDGAVRVHCHYCNTDYVFTDKDADEIFRAE